MTLDSNNWPLVCVLACLSYLILVRVLRYRRSLALQTRFKMTKREDLARMTADDAQAILKELTELEFPKFMGFSIVFALFKTYGLPSVSSLFVATGQLSSQETASKRIADTGVLLLEFALNAPSSERAIAAIARMNFLHAPYVRAGKISNSDMLYTLSVFALEPVRWVNKYERRHFTELELCAAGTYWKALGDAMEISFADLPSCSGGWRDGLHWLQEVEAWSLQYEKERMMPAAVNSQLANAHLDVLFINVPARLNSAGKCRAAVLLGERCRKAMMLPKPPEWYYCATSAVLTLRKLFLRHFHLPRPEFLRKDYISALPDKQTGRFSSKEYLSHPWYVKPTFTRRWGPRAWVTRLLGRKLPGDDGNRYSPEGYLIPEVGPVPQIGKGLSHMEETKDRLTTANRGGCPFKPPKA